MTEILLFLILLVSVLTAILSFLFLLRPSATQDLAKDLREELRAGRDEARTTGKELRAELSDGLKLTNDTLSKTLESSTKAQQSQLEGMTGQLKDLTCSNQSAMETIRGVLDDRVKELQDGNEKRLREVREEVSNGLKLSGDSLSNTLAGLGKTQETQLVAMTRQLKDLADSNQSAMETIRGVLDDRVKELQDGNEKRLREVREEVSTGLKLSTDSLSKTLEDLGKTQATQLESMTRQLKDLTDSNQGALDRVRGILDARVKELQEGNEKKLEEMRKTVDEKLHDTLEKRLGESFKLVSDRLEAVQKGLGEMQSLATGVGDLKRVLTNVKARGTWAEVQLGAILEEVLTPTQFERNVRIKDDSTERVEFAIRLPGRKDDPEGCVWLPIDSKFPQEDYLRIQDAADKGDLDAIQRATDALAKTIRVAGKDIHEKYVAPPRTTDFGIMFLATEGLYAEVLRQPALVDELFQQYRVVAAGPTTLAAILSSLRMGFQTLAIEQRATEVWKVLGAVKTEFGKFGEVLNKVKRQLNIATHTLEETGVRTRAMARRLLSVEQLPEAEAAHVLDLSAAPIEIEEEVTEEVGVG